MRELDDLPTPWVDREVRRVQRRPKDRKQQITRAAAELFNQRGYYGASMQDIAERVGISAPALYRHYPNKYALFSAAMIGVLTDGIVHTAGVDTLSDAEVAADPCTVIDLVVGGMLESVLLNRKGAGIHRWQIHRLNAADLGRVSELMETLHRRIKRPLMALRPGIAKADRVILQWGALSVVGSVIDHGTVLPIEEIHSLLSSAVRAIVSASLPELDDIDIPDVPDIFSTEPDSYEELMCSAMAAFGDRGYTETTMADLAELNNVSITELYRHFSGKSDILATGMRWVTNQMMETVRTIAADLPPSGALLELIRANTERVFAHPKLTTTYYTEIRSLDPEEQNIQIKARRAMRGVWVDLLTAERPELTEYQARFLVHAAASIPADLCRVFGYNRYTDDGELDKRSAHLQACMQVLMRCTLFGELS